jgi:hypothetical protein
MTVSAAELAEQKIKKIVAAESTRVHLKFYAFNGSKPNSERYAHP